jgi:NitT/TauT family transport system ATP-binding protein
VRALANDPGVLVTDESFAALDAQTRSMMQMHLLAVWSQSGKTVVIATPIDKALLLTDRIVIRGHRPRPNY